MGRIAPLLVTGRGNLSGRYTVRVNLGVFAGKVEKGNRRGTALGFPTINIPLTDSSVSGVYAGKVRHNDREYHAAIFADPTRGVLEAYLLDFDEDLYGENIAIVLMKKIRESKLFADDEKLKAMIAKDTEEVEKYFSSSHNR